MRQAAERAYFALCLALGRLLRSARYARVHVVGQGDGRRVRKRRLAHAPLLVRMGAVLVRVLDTGVRVLPQREWEARERRMYERLHGAPVVVERGGTLVLPLLEGETLAVLLDGPALEERDRRRAIVLAVGALADLHGRGLTHGDAMAENVMVDLRAGRARWFDFETEHDPRRPLAWRRADDVRALLATCLVRSAARERVPTVRLVVDAYGDEGVAEELARSFDSALRRPLAFHLGQAPLSWRAFREIGAALREGQPRTPDRPAARGHGEALAAPGPRRR